MGTVEVGFKGTNNKGEPFEVIESLGSGRYLVRFGRSGFIRNARKDAITKGCVSDPHTPTVCGVGYIGVGEYKSECNGKATPAYSVWSCMIGRCYNPHAKEYPRYGAAGVSVCEGWHNFQVFAEFFYKNWQEGLQLEKDILQPGNKQYCPEFCRFVPCYLNNLLVHQKNISNGLPVGVYYMKPGPRMVGELKKPYMTEYRKKSLGTFSDPMLAHRAWQLNKAESIDEAVNRYRKEKWFDTGIADALLLRAEMLRNHAAIGLETVRL